MSSHSGSHVMSMFEHPVPMVKTRIKRQSQIVCRCAKLLLRHKVHLGLTRFHFGQSRHMSKPQKSKILCLQGAWHK